MLFGRLRRMTETILDTQSQRSSAALILSFAAAWIFSAAADWYTNYELSLDPFYVLIVCIATWHLGWRWGIAFAVLSVCNQMAIGEVLGHPYSQPAYFFVTNFNKFFSSCLMVALCGRLRVMHQHEKLYARVDYLTGALNNMGFFEALSVELARHRREKEAFSVAYFDCDNFKNVNDRHGHRAGDELLRLIVHTMKRCLRKTDVIARLGGDEFAVLLPKTAQQPAESVVQELLYALNMAIAANDFSVTFSVGVGVFPETPASEDVVLSFAEHLMYRVKADGKNSAVYETCTLAAEASVLPADRPDRNAA
jgi:diguanylate cyclase (GGDEF)-like protein